MRIVVETLSGRSTAVEVTAASTVRGVKLRVQAALGIPHGTQMLSLDGHVLDNDDLTLADYHVGPNAQLRVAILHTSSKERDRIKELPLLQTVMMKSFGVFVGVTLLLLLIAMLVNVILVGQATRDEARDGLTKQVRRHLESASVELAAVVDMKLSSTGGALVGVLVDVLKQSIGKPANSPLHDTTDYTAANIPSAELSYIARRGDGSAHGSLKHSVTMLAGNTRTAAVNTRTRESAHMNAFFPHLWNEAPDVVALYAGFEVDGLFRQYPGQRFEGAQASYNPRVRPWYVAAKAASRIIHTDPYLDAFGLGWMISLAQQVSVSGTMYGVVSIDVKVSTIQSSILNSKFAGTSAASLVAASGVVVASPHWNSASATNTAKIYNLPGSGINTAMWNSMLNPANGPLFDTTISGAAYTISRAFVPAYDPNNLEWQARYVVLVQVNMDEAVKPLATMDDKIESSTVAVSLISVAATLVTLAAIVVVAHMLVKDITRPLKAMREVATKITSNATGQVESGAAQDVDGGVDEIGEFVTEFKRMLGGLSKGSTKSTTVDAGTVDNQFNGRDSSTLLGAHPSLTANFTNPLELSEAHAGAGAGAGVGAGAGAGAGAGVGATPPAPSAPPASHDDDDDARDGK